MTDQHEASLTRPRPRSWFQLGSTRTVFCRETAEAREDFDRFQAISIESLLEPSLQATLVRLCETGGFAPDKATPGFREVETPQRVGRALNLALNRPRLLRWLEDAAGLEGLHSIEGRVAQTLCRAGDELQWHDDLAQAERRRLAVVINLSTSQYQGGEFELRFKSGATLVKHRYTEVGSAMIFKVDSGLEHRVTPLRSGGPRRVFAGWILGDERP